MEGCNVYLAKLTHGGHPMDDVPMGTRERMLMEIVLGKTPKAENDAERQVIERLTDEVEKIRSQGGIVEIPHDWP